VLVSKWFEFLSNAQFWSIKLCDLEGLCQIRPSGDNVGTSWLVVSCQMYNRIKEMHSLSYAIIWHSFASIYILISRNKLALFILCIVSIKTFDTIFLFILGSNRKHVL